MQRKPPLARTFGAWLFCLLCVSIALAQTEKSNETARFEISEREKNERRANYSESFRQLKFSNNIPDFRARRIFTGAPNPAASFSIREWSAGADFSFGSRISESVRRRRRGGIQYLLSSASGITQLGDAGSPADRLLISSNGQRPTANNFTIDGIPINLGVAADETSLAGNLGALPALTAAGGMNIFAATSQTRELSVKTMGGAKEQRVGGADINIASRAGNNAFHGSLFEIFGNEKLNANDFFANARALRRAPARLNQFGGTLGGDIWGNKAWFFTGYDGLRLRQAGFALAEVPSLGARLTAPGSLRALLQAFPVPPSGLETSNGFSEFAATYANPAAHDIFSFRADVQPQSDWRFGGRYNFARSHAALRADRDFSLNTIRRLDTRTGAFSAWSSYTPGSSAVVASGRVNFSRHRVGQEFTLDDFGGGDPRDALFSTPFDFLKFDFAGKNSALAAGRPIASRVRQFQASGGVDWSLGDHQLSFGADFRRLSLAVGAARTERSVLFSRVSPGFELMTARVNELTRNLSENPEITNFSLFAQHNWRLGTRLILTLGARWDADYAPAAAAQTPDIEFQNASLRMRDNLKSFAPRAAFAFDLFDNGRATLRGGAGLFYDYGNAAASDAFANSFPFAAGAFARDAIFTAAPATPLRPLELFDNNLRTPRTWHFFAEYQQALFYNHILTATYTASRARRLFLTRTLLDADPTYNYIRLTTNDAAANHDSFELRVERRFMQGLSFNARYALSKTTDNFSPDAQRETNFVSADLRAERGAADFDARHQLNFYGVYDIPTFFSDGWSKSLTEDWSLSVFANARTAFPLTVGYDRVNDFGKEFVRADRLAGVPLYARENGLKTLNPNAFAIRDFDRQGTLGRNAVRGFPFFQIDASLLRRLRFTNETRLELGIAAFNLFNNTNFANMNGSLGTLFSNGNFLPNEYFGKPTATFGGGSFTPFYLYGGARTIQLSAKFVF